MLGSYRQCLQGHSSHLRIFFITACSLSLQEFFVGLIQTSPCFVEIGSCVQRLCTVITEYHSMSLKCVTDSQARLLFVNWTFLQVRLCFDVSHHRFVGVEFHRLIAALLRFGLFHGMAVGQLLIVARSSIAKCVTRCWEIRRGILSPFVIAEEKQAWSFLLLEQSFLAPLTILSV